MKYAGEVPFDIRFRAIEMRCPYERKTAFQGRALGQPRNDDDDDGNDAKDNSRTDHPAKTWGFAMSECGEMENRRLHRLVFAKDGGRGNKEREAREM